MAKRTAIIDIGSNSLSLVIYEKSSRYAFHLIEKVRAGVRIGEGAYEQDGMLQVEAMDRAFEALEDFLYVANNVKCRKILCVATSALRDAPNKSLFLSRVRKELGLNIKIIDGEKEAYYGAVAAMNLLQPLESFTTIDIGGGSTELTKVENGKIVDTLSLDIGTVRIKELFTSCDVTSKEVKTFIKKSIAMVPAHFQSSTIVGIGGTIRALSSAIMIKEKYPIKSLHGFEYRIKDYEKLLNRFPGMKKAELRKYEIPSSRYDTIREGSAIFAALITHLGSDYVISSKAGVREGVYLSDILRNSNGKFPHNFNVSIKSLIDRFALNEKNCAYVQRLSLALFDQLESMHHIPLKYRKILGLAAKLSPISKRINIYSNSDNSFYFLLENLNFVFAHEEKVLLSLLLKLSQKEKVRHKEYKKYAILLPSTEIMEWLHFLLRLSECINRNRKIQKFSFSLSERELDIVLKEGGGLCKECLEKLKVIASLKIKLKSSS